MFTGIIETIGTIRSIRRGARSITLHIAAPGILEGTAVGDSIATNGVCLTVTSIERDAFTADAMPETMQHTALGSLQAGSRVNLERALRLDSRLGGHMVSGHIDGTGTLAALKRDDNAIRLTVTASPDITRYIIPKGSVALDGVSLTVTGVTSGSFEVSIIPHTQHATTLTSLMPGTPVNIENDLIAKYIEKLLPSAPQGLTLEKLIENGF